MIHRVDNALRTHSSPTSPSPLPSLSLFQSPVPFPSLPLLSSSLFQSPVPFPSLPLLSSSLFQFPIFVPLLFLGAILFLLIVPLYAAPYDTGMGLVIVCSGIPVYIVGVAWKRKPKIFEKFVSEYTPEGTRWRHA